jgi:hypothetical protein
MSIYAAADGQTITADVMTGRKIFPENLIIAHW